MRALLVASGLMVAGLATYTSAQPAGAPPAGEEWRTYGSDLYSSKYSPLDQINADNVSQLQVAWRWKSLNFGPRMEGNLETTPLMIDGVLYFTAGQRRVILAADAATGETLGMYRPEEGERASLFPRPYSRGVSYWSNGQGDNRILAVTAGEAARRDRDDKPDGRCGTGRAYSA